MPYDKEEILKKALEIAQDESKNVLFIEELITHLPISKPTFYVFYPPESDGLNSIKELIDINKVRTKSKMRTKWYKSDNPTLQISLMKLIGDNEERQKLSQQFVDHTTKGDKFNITWHEEIDGDK